jgi:hypothetical protein
LYVKTSFLAYPTGLWEYDKYFRLKKDDTCKLGFTSYQKCIAVVRMLSYGVVSDLDEYMRVSELTFLESMYKFYRAVVQEFA